MVLSRQSLTSSTDANDTETNVTSENDLVLHVPDPADYFPPYLRREFLLEDGSRTVIPTRNSNVSYVGEIFYTFRNGTVYELRAIKELFGSERSPALQVPSS